MKKLDPLENVGSAHGLSLWLKSSLVPLYLASSLYCRFCVNDYIAKLFEKIACNISSCHFGVRWPVIQPFLKF